MVSEEWGTLGISNIQLHMRERERERERER